MCGIAGYCAPWGVKRVAATATAAAMTDAIAHRGPDDSGMWIDEDAGIVLGHRRLAVIDLSPAGHQPMASRSGRYVVVYNGEIYNFQDLRRDLDPQGSIGWRGHSDTEVMLAGFDRWGVQGTLERANGMFSLAVWDRAERRLTLARDRFGEKPLYYGSSGGVMLFGSELKALTRHPAFDGSVDGDALGAFLRYGYVPAPLSIWSEIHKLPPASLVEYDATTGLLGEPRTYWDFAKAATGGLADLFEGDPLEAMEALLRDAVAIRMEADVPVGAFLSGGVDSSLIVALMQAQSKTPVRTFTIGFDDPQFDESPFADAIARHLGTEHHALQVSAADALAVIPDIPTIWDEPFGDTSQIPTFLVSRLAAGHVTVSLSGDGGDEVFGGYNRYLNASRLDRAVKHLPLRARRAAGSILSAGVTRRLINATNRRLPASYRQLGLDERFAKLGNLLGEPGLDAIYSRLISHNSNAAGMLAIESTIAGPPTGPAFADARQRMMFRDTIGYLPDDILAKVDRASMAVSLESRVPFLDHRVVEAAWQLPMDTKIRGGRGKLILRRMLSRFVPDALIERPKMGFAIPIATWLRGPLKDWAADLVNPQEVREDGFLDSTAVSSLWDATLAGRSNAHVPMWDILMFQAWKRRHLVCGLSDLAPLPRIAHA